MTEQPPQTLAAIDLGSNSFHMLVAQPNEFGELDTLDKLRESVRLGEGLTEDGTLSPEVQQRGLDCLARFQQRISQLPPGNVRIVGTNTLRKATDVDAFIAKAYQILKHPIEVISGQEEARLIYLGVAHGHASQTGKRLVIDIGGGSTELMLGEGMTLDRAASISIGCVSHSLKFFPGGSLNEERFRRAIIQAKLSIMPIFRSIVQTDWQSTIGCSGTIKAIRRIIREQQWDTAGITLDALQSLKDALIDAGHVDDLSFPSLKKARRPVLPGGLAILLALFELLGISSMEVSKQALREGLLYDLLDRVEHKDIRDKTVTSFMKRWNVDEQQARRVAQTAAQLHTQVQHQWDIAEPHFADFLRWAALLHEVGRHISQRRHHKHGAYILSNADLSGFSDQEQRLLADLVLCHRRKFRPPSPQTISPSLVEPARKLCLLLRIAVLLHRKREDTPLPTLTIKASEQNIALFFPPQWLTQHSLLKADLEKEAMFLAQNNIQLEFQ